MKKHAHVCPFEWCEQRSTHPDDGHAVALDYTPATMDWLVVSTHDIEASFPVVGAGVRFIEAQGVPAVYLHLSGGARQFDIDVYMRPDEAQMLLESMVQALTIARST